MALRDFMKWKKLASERRKTIIQHLHTFFIGLFIAPLLGAGGVPTDVAIGFVGFLCLSLIVTVLYWN